MFKWYVTKVLHFIRSAKYKPAKNRLFMVDDKGDLCACALGQVALGLNLVTEDDARVYAKGSRSSENPVYEKLREFFKNDEGYDITADVPTVNDYLFISEPKFFEKVARELETRWQHNPVLKEQ